MENDNLFQSIRQEFRVKENGQIFVSVIGLSRFCDVSDAALHKADSNLKASKMGKFLANKGFQGSNLITSCGIPDTVATLVIEYYAFEAGRYCTEQAKKIYRTFAAIGFRTWVQQELSWNPTQSLSQAGLVETVINVIDLAFKGLEINQALIAGCKLNAAAKILPPEANTALEESRKLLAATTTIPDRLLTPTEIGKELGISGRAANKLLVEKGLQIKNPDKKSKGAPTYLPTERGHEFCDLTIATGKSGDNTSYQSLKWYPSVVRVIEG